MTDTPLVALGIVRQMIRLVVGQGNIVELVQEWPCWLPVALAWDLQVAVVYVQTRFHPLFNHWVGDMVA